MRQAIVVYTRALEIFRESRDHRYIAHALGNLGTAYAELREGQKALPYLEEALTYAHAVGDRRFEGNLWQALGEVAHTLGEPDRAFRACETAMTIAREIGDHQQEGYLWITLGCTHSTCNEPAAAMTAFDQALTIFQDVGDRWGLATCRWHYGLALADQHDYGRALPLLQASVAYLAEIGHTETETRMRVVARLRAGEE